MWAEERKKCDAPLSNGTQHRAHRHQADDTRSGKTGDVETSPVLCIARSAKCVMNFWFGISFRWRKNDSVLFGTSALIISFVATRYRSIHVANNCMQRIQPKNSTCRVLRPSPLQFKMNRSCSIQIWHTWRYYTPGVVTILGQRVKGKGGWVGV